MKNRFMEQAAGAASAEALRQMAGETGHPMEKNEAETLFALLHSSRELNDSDLSRVSGGSASGGPRSVEPRTSCFTGCFDSLYSSEGLIHSYDPRPAVRNDWMYMREYWYREGGRKDEYCCGCCRYLEFRFDGSGLIAYCGKESL